jgi:hypothetical protein
MTTVLFATAEGIWAEDVDAALLTDACTAAGLDARPAVWDDPAVDWAVADLVLVRSTWDYVQRLDEFLAWADRIAAVTRLANSPAVLRWNTDKRYLGDLERGGVPVVPTGYLLPDDRPDDLAAAVVGLAGTGHFVVKPTVSAGSKDTARYRPEDLAQAVTHAADLLDRGRPVMVQPYLDAVDTAGEAGLVLLDGVLSHAFTKGPLLTVGAGMVEGLFAPEEISSRVASAAEQAVAAAAADYLRERFGDELPRYARVDLLTDADGAPRILELELTEPSMFLWTDPGSPDRVADAVVRWATA